MSHASDSLSPPPSPGPEPPYTALLDKVRDPQPTDWEHAWVGLAPTFSSRELLKRWKAATKKGSRQADFFHHPEVRKLQRAVARAMERTYQRAQRRGESYCLFDRVERDESIDPHGQPQATPPLLLSRRWAGVHGAARTQPRGARVLAAAGAADVAV
jgi:hypothetical protein